MNRSLISILALAAFFLPPTPTSAQSCQDPPPYESTSLAAFHSHSYVPLPSLPLPTTLWFIDVPMPPEVYNGIKTTTPIGGSYGFQFDGAFYTSGSGVSDNFSHHALFWHDHPTSYFGYEYGFVSRLQNKQVQFYLCADCNTSSQRASEVRVVDGYLNGVAMRYDVQVKPNGDFQVEVRRLDNNNLVTSMTVAKPWWMANLYLVDGNLTAVSHSKVNKTAFHDSYLELETLKMYSPQCIIP